MKTANKVRAKAEMAQAELKRQQAADAEKARAKNKKEISWTKNERATGKMKDIAKEIDMAAARGETKLTFYLGDAGTHAELFAKELKERLEN